MCGEYAAQLYGLNILERSIETNKRNFTRFLILADPLLAAEIGPDESKINKALDRIHDSPHQRSVIKSAHHPVVLRHKSVKDTVDAHTRARMGIPILRRLHFDSYARYRQSIEAIKPLINDLRILGEYTECKMKSESTTQIVPAKRVSEIQEYYFSRRLREVAQLNAQGADIISLGIGGPDRPPHSSVISTLADEAAKPGNHSYQPYVGIPQLRRAMADWYNRWYGVTLNPDTEIQPLIGSKEGILHVSLAFLNPGDGVLVPNPGYPTYTSVSRLAQAEIFNYDLTEEGGWMPDFDALERLPLDRIKLMWINYPHMPTGTPGIA